MANYTINELINYWSNNVRPTHPDETPQTFLFDDYFNPPEDEEAEDTRPIWVKSYVDVDINTSYMIDYYIRKNYGDWVFIVDYDSIERAWDLFRRLNIIYAITHTTELMKVWEAFNTEFNPVENYDRYENTTVHGHATTGTTSRVAPDDSEQFFNSGDASGMSDSNTGTTSHIHGNIGVTEAVTMVDHSVQYFGNNAFIDFLINKIISENCYLCDYGDNAL